MENYEDNKKTLGLLFFILYIKLKNKILIIKN